MNKPLIKIDENFKKYLPSKQFMNLIVVCIALAILFFIISSVFSKKNLFFASSNDKEKLQSTDLTLNNLLQKDSDGDGVMDWEEALWGTNPSKISTFNGMKDNEYIKMQRANLGLPEQNGVTEDGTTINETDKFAQEFFASLVAMKQNGGIDQNTINNVSTSLGQEIINPNIIDKYTQSDLKKINNTNDLENMQKYYIDAGTLFEKYKSQGIGDELNIVGNIASINNSTTNPALSDKLTKIADAYKEYAQKMTELSVPSNLVTYHLKIINSANNTGIAVNHMVNLMTDPVLGISGLSQYQKYSEDLISSVGSLETFLSNNGIMIE